MSQAGLRGFSLKKCLYNCEENLFILKQIVYEHIYVSIHYQYKKGVIKNEKE